MTPCITIVQKDQISYKIHEYACDPSAALYGNEAAKKMGVSEKRVFKTLVVSLGSPCNNDLAVGVVPVSSKLNMKLMAKASGSKKASMAEAKEVERSTGYVLGGVSPLGQKKRLKTIIDISAQNYPTIFISAGRRGLEVELNPEDLKRLTHAVFSQICLY